MRFRFTRGRVLALALVLLLVLLFSPLYEQAFYAMGWKHNRVWVEMDANGQQTTHQKSGKHLFPHDVNCVAHRIADGDAGAIWDLCFRQGPPHQALRALPTVTAGKAAITAVATAPVRPATRAAPTPAR